MSFIKNKVLLRMTQEHLKNLVLLTFGVFVVCMTLFSIWVMLLMCSAIFTKEGVPGIQYHAIFYEFIMNTINTNAEKLLALGFIAITLPAALKVFEE